ncbi:MAG: hypothetical protein QNK23_05890 [Crocinitomicaceae bacterium]|nr:hypothetical protein [Crocinitomicaceae bacterium]
MKQLFVLLFIANFTFANHIESWTLPVSLEKSEKDPNLTNEESIFRFNVNNISDENINRVIIYSINGREKKAKLIDNAFFDIRITPGKYIFQFYYDQNYAEIFSDSLIIKGGFRDIYSLNFDAAGASGFVWKPVIYLYPDATTPVTVSVNVVGNNPFFYPEYNDTWEFTATPQGELKFENASYNYLFWEANQYFRLSVEEHQSGFICEGDNVVAFIEEKLTMAGLTTQEQADFITFWGPRLQRNELNYVHFMFNEECDAFAELSISPKPDHLYRIYIIWSPLENEIPLEPQTILPMDRSGFSVLEWGGMEQPIIENLEIN